MPSAGWASYSYLEFGYVIAMQLRTRAMAADVLCTSAVAHVTRARGTIVFYYRCKVPTLLVLASTTCDVLPQLCTTYRSMLRLP